MKFSDLDLLRVGHDITITGAIFSGDGHHYLCFLPGEGEDVEVIPIRLRMDGDEWNKFLRQTDLLETEILQTASDGTVAKAILRKSARQISQNVSWTVFRRDNFACRYCGNEVPLTVDHLVLWEHGGPSIEANLLAACRPCNKKRGNTEYGDWLKSPHYLKVSSALTEEQREANAKVLGTLDAIPRKKHKGSR